MGFAIGGGEWKPRKPRVFHETGVGSLKDNYLSGYYGTVGKTLFFCCTGRDITSPKQLRKLATWLERAADYLEYRAKRDKGNK